MKIIRQGQVQIFRILALALGLLATAGAQAATWYVATNGLDSNPGSLALPYLTISNALTNASSGGDTIKVSNGVYTLTATVSNPAAKAFKIQAWSTNPADTVLLGSGSNASVSFCGVWMSGAGSTLEGFTVTNFYYTNSYATAAGVVCHHGLISNCVIAGNIQGYTNSLGAIMGGGIYLSTGVVENCDIIGNSVYPAIAQSYGAGIAMENSGRIRNCRIVGNMMGGAKKAAGVYAGHGSDFVIQDSIIASNIVEAGGDASVVISGGIVSNCRVFAHSGGCGGISVWRNASYPQYTNYICIVRCVISNNTAMQYIGGLNINSDIRLTNALVAECTIVNNACSGLVNGGGLCVGAKVQNVWIRNCLVAYNLGTSTWGSDDGGGGMQVLATNALIENCTVVSNTLTGGATTRGAGLLVSNGVRVVNSVIYDNVGVTTSNIYATAGSTFSNCCTAPLSDVVGTGNTEVNPLFVAKDIGNFRLNDNSPCINAGLNQSWMEGAVDLDGRSRTDRFSRRVDMGAYEHLYAGTIYTVH